MNIENKTLLVYMSSDLEHSCLIEHARLEEHHGKVLLVGTVPKSRSCGDWADGVPCLISWRDVNSFLVFDSIEHFEKCMAKSKGKKKWLR